MIRWSRFSWNLADANPTYPQVEPRYHFRAATSEDEAQVRQLVVSAFKLDPDWSPLFTKLLQEPLEEALDLVFSPSKQEGHPAICLVINHGSRIIGASIVQPRPDADNHLLTGPCVPMEYRNRGLATALLAESLKALRDAQISVANGVTLANVPTEEFVYTKFGSTKAPFRWNKQAPSKE